jgi:hypothetical protein
VGGQARHDPVALGHLTVDVVTAGLGRGEYLDALLDPVPPGSSPGKGGGGVVDVVLGDRLDALDRLAATLAAPLGRGRSPRPDRACPQIRDMAFACPALRPLGGGRSKRRSNWWAARVPAHSRR